jgi:hypothetical protein
MIQAIPSCRSLGLQDASTMTDKAATALLDSVTPPIHASTPSLRRRAHLGRRLPSLWCCSPTSRTKLALDHPYLDDGIQPPHVRRHLTPRHPPLGGIRTEGNGDRHNPSTERPSQIGGDAAGIARQRPLPAANAIG